MPGLMVFHAVCEMPDAFRDSRQFLAGDVLAVHLYAFAEVLNIRRGIEPGTVARCPQDGIQHGAGGTFAVAAGNVDKLEMFLGTVQRVQEFHGSVEAEAGGAPGVVFNIGNGFLLGHKAITLFP